MRAHAYARICNKEGSHGRTGFWSPPTLSRLRCPAVLLCRPPLPSSSVLCRPPPPAAAPSAVPSAVPSVHTVPSAVLRFPLYRPACARAAHAAFRRTANPNFFLLLPDFNLQSMLCSIIPKDFREKIWRVGVKCRSLQSALEEKREKKQSAVVRRNHLRTRAKGLAFPSRDFLRDKNISEKIWREVKKCVLLHSLNGTRVL